MPVDHLSPQERVKIGLTQEEHCVSCLNRYLSANRSQRLVPANSFEDKSNKTDAFLIDIDGDEEDMSLRCAVKVRESRNDILVAVKDPWYGEGSSSSKIGRDMLVSYHWYITRDKAMTTLRVADGAVVHKTVNDLWEEWVERGYEDKPELRAMSSRYNPGCEMRRHNDRFHGHPKILAFIPPDTLGKHVFFVPYDGETYDAG